MSAIPTAEVPRRTETSADQLTAGRRLATGRTPGDGDPPTADEVPGPLAAAGGPGTRAAGGERYARCRERVRRIQSQGTCQTSGGGATYLKDKYIY